MTIRRAAPELSAGADSQAPIRPASVARLLLAAGGARIVVLPISAVCNLVIARLTTLAVGIDQYGVVMLVATLSQVLIFADLGAGAPLTTARAQVGGTQSGAERFRRTTLTAIRTTLCSAGLVVLVALILGLLGLWPPLLGVHGSELSAAVNLAAVLSLAAFGAALPFRVGEAVLRGGGRQHEAVLLVGLSAPAALAITVVLYAVDAPPLAYALPIPLGFLLSAVCSWIRARQTDKAILRGIAREIAQPGRYPGVAIFATAAPFFVVMIGLPLALQSDRLVLAHRVDPASLSDYSYVAQVYTPLWSVVSLAALALWPYFATEDQGRRAIRKGWLTGIAILGSAGLLLAAAFLLLARYVVQWMSAGTSTPGWSLLLAFAGLLVIQSLHVTTGIMLLTPRQLTFQAVCVVALVLTNLPLSWILVPGMGAAGPVVASAITVAACQLVPGIIVANRATSTGSADA